MSYSQFFCAILASSGLWGFITFLITRKDKHKEELEAIKQQLERIELDTTRTQLLLLMSDYSEDKAEIFKLAEKYFSSLGGNFYVDTIFRNFLKEHKLPTPSWFKK